MEALVYEYEEVTKKASNEMYVEALPLEEDDKKSSSNNNIDAVSTEDVNNARSETLESLRTKDDTKYARSENIVQENVEEASS